MDTWEPPFISDDGPPDMMCPECDDVGCIQIHTKDRYMEGGVEAYCSNCHAMLEVQASVEITFSDPEVVYE